MANLSSTRIFGDGTVERSLYVKQRLGVGVGNPSAKLDVNGAALFSESYGTIAIRDAVSGNTDPAIDFRRDDWTSDEQFQLRALGGGGNERMTWDYVDNGSFTSNNILTLARGGNVGIGTSSPSYALDTDGVINTTQRLRMATSGPLLIGKDHGTSVGDESIAIGKGARTLEDTGGTIANNHPRSTVVGYEAGNNTGTGVFGLSALGYQALQSNTGNNASGFGYRALRNNTGNRANGFGYYALESNTGNRANGFGYYALESNTGDRASGFGHAALRNNTGDNANGVGYKALRNNTGTNANGVGYYALESNTGDRASGFGHAALRNNTGNRANGVGYYALESNTGNRANGFGYLALRNNAGDDNTALGHRAGYDGTYDLAGSDNTFLGANSTYQTSGSSSNITNATAVGANITLTDSNTVILGNNADVGIGTTSPTEKLQIAGTAEVDGRTVTTSNTNVRDIVLSKDGQPLLTHQTDYWNGSSFVATDGYGVGYAALLNNTGNRANGVGYAALRNNTGDRANGVGYEALESNTGNYANGFGYYALRDNTGTRANGFGHRALQNNTGNDANGVGYQALQSNTGANANGVGYQALQNNTANANGVGYQALQSNTGYDANGVGYQALQSNTGNRANGVGHRALRNNTGDYANGFGTYALRNNTGYRANGFGQSALQNNTGNRANGVGYAALEKNAAANNTALGHQAGYDSTYDLAGSDNTFLGANSTYQTLDSTSTITNATAVGANITLTDSNTVILGSGADVGIGTTSPSYKLEVNGTIAASGNVISYYSSDRRLKKNPTQVENPMTKIKKLTGVGFGWKENASRNGSGFGVFAQDAKKVDERLVRKQGDGYLGVDYQQFHAFEIEALKQVNEKVEENQSEIQRLKQRIAKLESNDNAI